MDTAGWPHQWVEDPRSPLLTFQLNNSNSYGFYFSSILFLVELMVLVILQACLVAAPISILVYYTIVLPRKKQKQRQKQSEENGGGGGGSNRRTTSATRAFWWFWGYGIILPFWILYPRYMNGYYFQIHNFIFRFLLCTTPATAIFRVLEAMYGFAPLYATRSVSEYALYFSSPMLLRYDDRTAAYIETSSKKIMKHVLAFLGFLLVTGIYQSLFSIFTGAFPRLGSSAQYSQEKYFNWQVPLDFRRWRESFFLAVLLQLYLCTFGEGFALVTSIFTGKQVEPLMDNPMFASQSCSDFWGRRWNLVVHKCLKDGIYKPVRSVGGSKAMAVAVSFFASGIFHEWLMPIIFGNSSNNFVFWDGTQLAFFMWQGALVAIESLIGHRQIFKTLGTAMPAQVRSALIVLLGLPPAPWFCELYANSDFFVQGHVVFFAILPIDSSSSKV